MHNKTVIYYTHNCEKESLTRVVQENILATKGDLPLLSVSQKPMDFGQNICVGDVGCSYLNEFRQLLIGCKAATTDYVVMAESDCLYPESAYFDFTPTDLQTIYNYANVWIVSKKLSRFFKKQTTHGSLIYGREFLISIIEEALEGKPEWSRTKVWFRFYKPEHHWENFTGLPLLNIKSGNGVNKRHSEYDTTIHPRRSIPYWGDIEAVKSSVFGVDDD